MKYVVSQVLLGSDKHLLHDSETKETTFVDHIPDDVWHLSGEQKNYCDLCLDSLLAINMKHISLQPEEKYVNVATTVFPQGFQNYPWQKLMTKSAHEMFIKTLLEKVDESLIDINTIYYKSAWVKENRIFNSLSRMKIDVDKWRILTLTNKENHMLKSFKPDLDGFAQHIEYNRMSTRTGRLTVKSGPQVLTLNKKFRNIIKSSYEDGIVGSLDFNALEMRLLLYEAGFYCDEPDLYEMIRRNHFPKIERNIVKGAVIGRAYGLSRHVWSKKLGLTDKQSMKMDQTLQTLIDTSFLLRREKNQFLKTGYIKNRYGRPIKVDVPEEHLLINFYAQSTGSDVSLLGYSTLLDLFDSLNVKVLFCLHDAIILDIPKSSIEEVKKISTVKVNGYVQKFYLKFETIT